MIIFIIIIVIALSIYLYNNGKDHSMVDHDVHKYNFALTDAGEWVNFSTVIKLTGDNNIIIQNPTEIIDILDVVEIEPNKFTGTLDHFKLFTTVYLGDEEAYLHIRGSNIKKFKKTRPKTKVDTHKIDRNNSLARLAKSYNCSPSEVKQNFINEFTSIQGSSNQEEEALNIYNKEKFNEAKMFNVDPNDTASAIMESWLIEFFANEKKKDLDRDFFSRGGIILMRNANKNIDKELKGEKYSSMNLPPSIPLDYNDLNIINLHKWAKYERRNADFSKTIRIVDVALNLYKNGTDYSAVYIHYFYSIKSKAHLGLNNIEESLLDMKNAYSELKKNDPNNLELIDVFYARILVLQNMISSRNSTDGDCDFTF